LKSAVLQKRRRFGNLLYNLRDGHEGGGGGGDADGLKPLALLSMLETGSIFLSLFLLKAFKLTAATAGAGKRVGGKRISATEPLNQQ
jgi:hypothetical protein